MEESRFFKIFKGLFKDSDEKDQPKGTVRFALNAVKESDSGEHTEYSTEESNEVITSITPGYIILGKCYMSNNRIAILSVSSDESASEIGIFNINTGQYVAHVNDTLSINRNKLNFKISHQIDVIYRLRQGCDDTIYWTDNNSKPRYYNFSSPQDFKDQNDNWVASKFDLQKTYEKIPEFVSVTVEDVGGTSVLPGSYNIAIQYVDQSLNPTEWIRSSKTVKIYSDSLSKPYSEITGSINSSEEHLAFGPTNKSIRVVLGNLDENYMYYRLAIICSNSGTGIVNEVLKTEIIPISKNFFVFTGDNYSEKGSETEILMVSDIIGKAKHIEQSENRLLLGNIQGRQVNLCSLQKYASRIKVDCAVKEITLNDMQDNRNSKHPSHEFNNGVGYMPGEIYSVGITYIFEDMSVSPVYHIPGKRVEHADTIFSPELDIQGNQLVYPMSADNSSVNTVYSENDSCGNGSVWGLDYGGQPLLGKPVRHQRFPLRSELGIPLVNTSYGSNQTNSYYKLQLKLEGPLKTPVPCPEDAPNCGTDVYHTFEIRVSYEVDGESYTFTMFVDPNTYADGTATTEDIEIYVNSQYHSSNNFSNITVDVMDINGDYIPQDTIDWSVYFPDNDPTLTITTEEDTSTVADKLVKSKILGFKFSNIELPSTQDTGGLAVIGYMIVRNERTETEKTILDSAIMLPNVKNGKYVANGLVYPEGTVTKSTDTFALLHPEHKFHQKEYTNFDQMICQGYFDRTRSLYSKVGYDDVMAGTSFNDKMHKQNDDADPADGSPTSKGLDGWSFNLITRDNIVDYFNMSNIYTPFTLSGTDFKERFYLDALESRTVNSGATDIYNISADNKIGMCQLKSNFNFKGLPYVVLKKNNSDPYSNFRMLPYYDEMLNPSYFSSNGSPSSVTIFNGDSYVTPMRYHSSVFYDNRIAKRKLKVPAWKFVVGALIAVIGIVTSVFSGGLGGVASAAAMTALFGTGIAIAGVGAMMISSGVKQANFNKAYLEEYGKGLRTTVTDFFTKIFYEYTLLIPFGYIGNGGFGQDGPSDDTILWASDCLTDVWLESSVNMNLRNRFTNSSNPTFLYSPWKVETGNTSPISTVKIKGLMYTDSNSPRYPVSSLERHGINKLLAFDNTRDDNKSYLGVPLGEYYHINPDYERYNKQKAYFHLPLEYDCCSSCQEKFPHRVYYSEQSFQEELSDNFRVFLPNNYRDIEGHTGEITNIFKLGNDLFIHTEEALWQLPRQNQERITDQIVSFIGTGDYFSVPPRPMIDDATGNSAGTRHKWGAVKTPHGIFFPSEHQNTIYKFDGRLTPISNLGYKSWFKDNMSITTDRLEYNNSGKPYPFRDNPSNPFGTGFVSVYDSKKERVIFTKLDNIVNLSEYSDYLLCINSGDLTIFPNMQDIINEQAKEGWSFVEVEDCTLRFRKDVVIAVEETISTINRSKMSDKTDIIVQLDMSDNFTLPQIESIKQSILIWFTDYKIAHPGYTGRIFFHTIPDCKGQKWLKILDWLISGQGTLVRRDLDPSSINYDQDVPAIFADVNTDFIVVSTVNESCLSYCDGTGEYHNKGISNPANPPTQEYLDDFDSFTLAYDDLVNQGYTMHFLQYPIVFDNEPSFIYPYYGMIQSVIFAIEGTNVSSPEVYNSIVNTPNPYVEASEWNVLVTSLSNVQLYPQTPDNRNLRDMNWRYVHYRGWDGASLPILPVEDFTEDMENFLFNDSSYPGYYVEETVTNYVMNTEYRYINGIQLTDLKPLNNSWTMSYDIQEDFWISLHSYLPSIYLSSPEKFFTWYRPESGVSDNNIYQHNIKGSYRRFRGKYFPFIVEFINNEEAIATKNFNSVTYTATAWRYSDEHEEFLQEKYLTFNKALFYNSYQTTGIINLIVKDTSPIPEDYLFEQVRDLDATELIIDRNEYDWSINQLRNMRDNYSVPMFSKNLVDRQLEYYIDKVVNEDCLDLYKPWHQQETLYDKYLAVRLIFDNFEDVKLVFNYQYETDTLSKR